MNNVWTGILKSVLEKPIKVNDKAKNSVFFIFIIFLSFKNSKKHFPSGQTWKVQ
jgi:hypothetical protein